MADNTYKIILEVENREELGRLQKDFDAAHQHLAKLNSEFRNGVISQAQYSKWSQNVAGDLDKLHTKITALQAVTKGGILGGASGGGMQAQGLLQMGYAIDDLQYGLGAIVNNIPQVVMGLGGSAGVAGAIGIAAVAINVLSHHWDEFLGKVKETGPAIEEAFKHATEAKGKEIVSRLEAILKGKTFEQKETEGLMKEYFESGIGEDVVGRLGAAIGASGQGAQLTGQDKESYESAKEEAEADQREGKRTRNLTRERLATYQKKLDEENVKEAGKLLAKAVSDPAARRRIAGLEEQAPGTMPKGFVEGMKGLEPEAVKQQDEELQQKIIEGEEAKHNREMRQRKNKADNVERKKQEAWLKKKTEDDIKTEVRGQQDMMHSQIGDLEKRKKKINEETKNKSQTFKDTQSFLSHLQEKALDKIPKEQLEKLKHIDDNIKILKDNIRDLGRLTS